MTKIVIMQPYYLAWYGFFEQIKLADIYVFYDDVQFVKRSLMSRVDIKTPQGRQWMTVPLNKPHQKDLINKITCKEDLNWREKHLQLLETNYKKAPFVNEMLELAKEIFHSSTKYLANVSITAIKKIVQYYGLDKNTDFYFSSELGVEGESSQRLLDISRHLNADSYVTGMGALKYMNFDIFNQAGVNVEFMDYAKSSYPQLYGEFNPYVSILDLIANTGKEGIHYMNSTTMHYKDFINTEEAKKYLKNNS